MALAVGLMATAQVKIGTDVENINPASILELESSTQGVNFPKLALTSTTVAAPLLGNVHVAGMTVYNTATAGDVTPGLYTNSGTAWVKLGGGTTPLYQSMRGKVTTVTTAYTVAADDFTVITNAAAGVIITLPTLTVNDAGRIINIINNNTVTNANTITSLANTLNLGTGLNQFRGRSYVWTGSVWLPIALN